MPRFNNLEMDIKQPPLNLTVKEEGVDSFNGLFNYLNITILLVDKGDF